MAQRPTALKATDAQAAPSSTPLDQPQQTPQMHDDDPPAASVAAHTLSSSARSASAVGAAVNSASSASSSSASVSTPAVAVVSASVGSKRKSRAADHAPAADAAVAASSSASASALMQSSQEKQPAAGAALSTVAPNAHLSSVLERGTASAPVAKRTRRAAQSAATAVAHARSSPMLRLLGTDSGARQSLLESMELTDIAQLQCTGRAWRGWIADAPFIGPRTVIIKGDQSDRPSRCPWIRRSVHHLQYEDFFSSIVPFDQLLLLQWSRLRSIEATLHRPLPSAELLRAGFAAVAATLRRLDVSLRDRAAISAVNLLPAITPLHQLESLTIQTCAWSDLDLSALCTLPRLQQFNLRFPTHSPHPCSPAQVSALARCKSLTDLKCGQWLPMGSIGEPAVQLTDAQLQQIENCLGRLWRLRQDNGAAPLRRLYLGSEPMILPRCWRVLSQFTALEELDACWSCTLTADDWMLLASFPQLHTLTIRALEYEGSRALLDFSVLHPGLVACRPLRSLKLLGLFDLRTERAALLAQIPSLESFCAYDLRIESLEPLSRAPSLTELNFFWCVGLNSGPINIRAMIPPMPLAIKLTITDHWLSRLTAEQAEPFNVILLARLPKLAPERFRQG